MEAAVGSVAPDANTKVATLSTESIASAASAPVGHVTTCPSCGSAVAPDQRYCLECGERRVPMSSLLFGGPPSHSGAQPTSPAAPPSQGPPPRPPQSSQGPQRNTTLTVIAGVGVLLLAMGVGVLIGRAGGNAKQSAPPAQVVTLAPQGATGTTSAGSEASFTSDWPSGTSGYTVQLQTLAQSGTSVSAVESAKTAAMAKGAKSVGALKSEEFSSLASGNYVIYSGVYHTRAQAEKALGGLKKSFPGASVVKVSNGGGTTGSAKESEPSTSSPGGVGTSESKPAPPSVLNSLKGAKGKNYEQKSNNLPDVVETG
jgi:septal ring-binding cell division protein DamX